MAMNSTIEWTDHTFNPWTGCTNISPGCDNCYAEAWSKRSGHVKWGNSPRKRTTEAYWKAPHIWQQKAAAFAAQHARRQRVFCASLADVFDNQVDPSWRADLFRVIRDTPSLDWQLLTKRPQNIRKMLPEDWGTAGYPNVWLGFTAEDQIRFDQRKRFLAEIPAAVWFVSYEPAIGPLRIAESDPKPHWLISGGESGHNARPMNCQWARDIVNDCNKFGIAAFHKQWGAYGNNPMVSEQGMIVADVKLADPYGKGGGLLDGRLVREFPKTRAALVHAA
ncbi:phage Gp37/Gp68 family protein [Brucella intermedia]|uniref:phage Gp37/Gp68 family protein n=1 Tax=Brucella intermedia TaxID=94625 RepID=UPI0023627CEE|nr:phage Gp37/Gp68 family protein [Brucella intermedia]